MKKMWIFSMVFMLLCLLTACTATPSDIQSETTLPPEDTAWTGILYADFSCGTTGNEKALIKEYPFEYTGTRKTAVELAEELSALTGLDFIITADKTLDGWVVDWSKNSTLVAGMDERQQKEDFFFFDADSLSWFMMDSLYQTLADNLDTETIYYTMDGGKELCLENLSPARVFPSDIPYLGSQFYLAHQDVQGEDDLPNRYYDEGTGLLLTYPGVFSSADVPDENGIVHFYTLWDTQMLYWTDPNEENSPPSAFRENLTLTETMELSGNVVIGYGEVEDRSGEMDFAAYYWVVDTEYIVNVMILCADEAEAAYWYKEFQNRAVYVENTAGVSPDVSLIAGCWSREDGSTVLQINEDGQAWYLENGRILFRGYLKESEPVSGAEYRFRYDLYNDGDVLMACYFHDPRENLLLLTGQEESPEAYCYQGAFSMPLPN